MRAPCTDLLGSHVLLDFLYDSPGYNTHWRLTLRSQIPQGDFHTNFIKIRTTQRNLKGLKKLEVENLVGLPI